MAESLIDFKPANIFSDLCYRFGNLQAFFVSNFDDYESKCPELFQFLEQGRIKAEQAKNSYSDQELGVADIPDDLRTIDTDRLVKLCYLLDSYGYTERDGCRTGSIITNLTVSGVDIPKKTEDPAIGNKSLIRYEELITGRNALQMIASLRESASAAASTPHDDGKSKGRS